MANGPVAGFGAKDDGPPLPSSAPGRAPSFSMRIVSGLSNFKLVFNAHLAQWQLQPATDKSALLPTTHRDNKSDAVKRQKNVAFWLAIVAGVLFIIIGASIAGVYASRGAPSSSSSKAGNQDGGVNSSASPTVPTTASSPVATASPITTTSSPVTSASPVTTSSPQTSSPASKSPSSTQSPVTTASPVTTKSPSSSAPTSKSPVTSQSPVTTSSPVSTTAPSTASPNNASPTLPPIPASQLLTISPSITVYVPFMACSPENCPPGLGECNTNTNTCVFNTTAGYQGLASYPHAFATEYCTLSPQGCLGVTYVNTPYTTASYIAGNFSLPICYDIAPANRTCVGIHASPSRMNGNAQTGKWPNGTSVVNWGMGLTEASGVCYRLTGPTGHQVVVAQTDRCGGYCTCSAQSSQSECGPCANDPLLYPNCPCVGTVPGDYSACCGLSSYGCPSTLQTCDWCASQNHPHFDLDVDTFNYLCDSFQGQGSCALQAAQPFSCLEPVQWPPGSGGGGGGGGGGVTCGTDAYQCPGGTSDPTHMPQVTGCLECCCNYGKAPTGAGCNCT